jgi:hypothetical protein
MDYMKNAVRRTIGSGELLFIRCDKDGNELSETELSRLNFSNSTIERVVGAAAERISPVFEPSEGIYSDGIVTS